MAIAFVFIILGIAIILFVTEALPMDMVAILTLLSMTLGRIITPAEAFLGFGDPVVITLTSFFVISAALFNTGVVEDIGHRLHRMAGDSQIRLLVTMMLTASTIAAFMSNVVTTAVLMPGVIGIAKRIKAPASMFLMPLAFGAILGGKCTLAGSPTNLAVNGLMSKYGLEPFGLFEFAPIGVPIVLTGVIYMVFLGSRLLPRRMNGLGVERQVEKDYLTELIAPPGSPLIGRTLAEADFRGKYDLSIIGIIRDGARVLPHAEAILQPGDVLLVRGKPDRILSVRESEVLDIKSDTMSAHEPPAGAPLHEGWRDEGGDSEMAIVEAVIAPNSTFVDRTLRRINFRSRYGVDVLAIYRHDQALYENLEDIQLKVGDMLLIQGRRRRINSLREDMNFLTLDDVRRTPLRKNKAALAIAIFAAVAFTAGLNLAPLAICSLAGAAAMMMAGCITAREAYARVHWPIIVLIAATLPMGLAMEKTGAAKFAANYVTAFLGNYGPVVVMGGLFLFAIALTQTMVNAAAALLLTPIAINVAQQLQVNPRSFAMTIAIAASTSFATPLEPACAIVYGPGRYRFPDYIRVGGILTICVMAVTLLVIPIFWPLH